MLCDAAMRVLLWAAAASAAGSAEVSQLAVDGSAAVTVLPSYFASWNIDPSRNRLFFDVDWADPQLRYLAAQIGGGRIRFGGGGANHLYYGVPTAEKCPAIIPHVQECLNTSMLDALLDFSAAVRTPLVFGLTLHPARSGPSPPDGPWNGTNARALLAYVRRKEQQASGNGSASAYFAGLELGNEDNVRVKGRNVSAPLAAAAFLVLQGIVDDLWPCGSTTGKPALIGPDDDGLRPGKTEYVTQYQQAFIEAIKDTGVNMYALTHHEYTAAAAKSTLLPAGDSGTQCDVLEPACLNRTARWAAAVMGAVRARPPGVEVWAGEIGPHIGFGGNSSLATCNGTALCGRFGSTIWYADAMAAKARAGYAAFFRQDLVGAQYALLNSSLPSAAQPLAGSWRPSPDYWVLWLWKRLVGPQVLRVGVPSDSRLRPYAFCSLPQEEGAAGGGGGSKVTLLLINLGEAPLPVRLPSFVEPGSELATYSLTTGDDALGVSSWSARLNGAPLALSQDGTLPAIQPKKAVMGEDGSVTLEPVSVAFVQVQSSEVLPACSATRQEMAE